ncbi:MAG: class I SAM-dependent methyltransferase [Elusimicrobiota bacterium]
MANSRIHKALAFYRENGLAALLRKIGGRAAALLNRKEYDRFVDSLDGRDHASVFSEIYEKNLWTTGESRSGAGSELGYTENLRARLPELFERFKIRALIDAPCGDFHWMREVPLADGMSYVGLDIVSGVIAQNQERYGDARRRFLVSNITRDPLPDGDLLMCRDCLFHLSNEDALAALKNFAASNVPYLLTSTHVNRDGFANTNIKTGEFRRIDLFSEPFCLPKDVLDRIEDFAPPFPPREMCLWTREQIGAALSAMAEKTERSSR